MLDWTHKGAWADLFPQALALMDHLTLCVPGAVWSFGGGTVLMLRYRHRASKDIDLFVPDPQYLGFVNPRLSDVAASVSADYDEDADFIKFYLLQGEIDVVAGQSLTAQPIEVVERDGRYIRVETDAEIVAKKFWHRGNRAHARDLFDLCAVHHFNRAAIAVAAPFLSRHADAVLDALTHRGDVLRRQFLAIDHERFKPSFEQLGQQVHDILGAVVADRSKEAFGSSGEAGGNSFRG